MTEDGLHSNDPGQIPSKPIIIKRQQYSGNGFVSQPIIYVKFKKEKKVWNYLHVVFHKGRPRYKERLPRKSKKKRLSGLNTFDGDGYYQQDSLQFCNKK